MRAILVQPQFEPPQHQPQSLLFKTASSQLAAALSMGLAAASLLIATPALAQHPAPSNAKQNLSCIAEGQRWICEVQQPEQASRPMTFQQKPDAEPVSKTEPASKAELTPVTRTALFNPELDGMLSSALLWTFYLSLPLTLIVAIWRYDRHARKQMATLLQQVATLERIWQQPQTR